MNRCLRRAARAGGVAFGSVLIAYSIAGCAMGCAAAAAAAAHARHSGPMVVPAMAFHAVVGAGFGIGVAMAFWSSFPVRRDRED